MILEVICWAEDLVLDSGSGVDDDDDDDDGEVVFCAKCRQERSVANWAVT